MCQRPSSARALDLAVFPCGLPATECDSALRCCGSPRDVVGEGRRTGLSRTHRDAAVPICPFAALGSEIARSSDEVKASAGAVLEELIALFSNGDSAPGARAEAIVTLCTLVGAMTLSRATADKGLSDEILKQAKHHLRELT